MAENAAAAANTSDLLVCDVKDMIGVRFHSKGGNKPQCSI